MQVNDWKKIVEAVEQPVIITGITDNIIYANKKAKRLSVETLIGKPLSQIVDRNTAIDDDIVLFAGQPMKIVSEFKSDNNLIIVFTEIASCKEILTELINDVDLYGFFAKSSGDFLGSTVKMRKLLNKDPHSTFVEDGWTLLMNTLRSEEISGNAVREMFLKKKHFMLSVPAGPMKGKRIFWIVGKVHISDATYIMAVGNDHEPIPIDTTPDLVSCVEHSMIPIMIINDNGVQLVDSKLNLAPDTFDQAKSQDLKKYLPDEIDRLKVTEIIQDIAKGRGRSLNTVMKINLPSKMSTHYAVQGYDVDYKGVRSLLMMVIDVEFIMKRVSKLEQNKKMIELYNSVLNYMVQNDDAETMLKLITNELAIAYSASSKCLGEVRKGIFKSIWRDCDRMITDECCSIAHEMTIRAVADNDILISTNEETEEIEMVVPIKLKGLKDYIMSFCFASVEHNTINFLYNLKRVVEIGLEGIATQHELKEKTNNLEKLHSFRSEILEAVNHDLKTPLTSILGYAELLKMGTLKKDEVAESVESIAKSAETLNGLIDNLSAYTSLVTKDTREKTTRIDICDFTRDIITMMKPIFTNRNIKCERLFPDDKVCIDINKTKLEEMVINILSNAYRYAGMNGKIMVAIDRLDNKIPRLTISDDGPGIKDEVKEKVFEKYGRDADSPEGKGLGLYLTKKYIESIGGSITLASPGLLGGATFCLIFSKCEQSFI